MRSYNDFSNLRVVSLDFPWLGKMYNHIATEYRDEVDLDEVSNCSILEKLAIVVHGDENDKPPIFGSGTASRL